MTTSSQVKGGAELQATLSEFGQKAAGRIARSVLGAGITAIKRHMVRNAPRGKTGATKASVGRRLVVSRRTGFVTAKAGVNVGKRSKAAQAVGGVKQVAPHAHLTALGTVPRFRRRIGGRFGYLRTPKPEQLSTGAMPASDWIGTAYTAALSDAQAAMEKAGQKAVARELARAKK